MKKKILSLVLLVALVLSSMPISAVKRETVEQPDLVAGFGSFKNEKDLENMKVTYGQLEWVKDGAPGSPGALKYTTTTSAFGFPFFEVPNVVGETYDISFYARTDVKGNPKLEFIMRLADGSWDTSVLVSTYSSTWTKYSFSYYCDGTNYLGEPNTSNLRLFDCRLGGGKTGTTYYLDELSVVPRGNVPYDYNKPELTDDDIIPADDGFATPQPVNEADFSDDNGHWAEDTISMIGASGIVNGMGDGTFVPDGNVTRAQFATMIMNWLRVTELPYAGVYRDVNAGDWYAGAAQRAYAMKLMHPVMTAGEKFSPNQPITRQEAAYMLYQAAQVKNVSAKASAVNYTDNGKIATWAKDAVKAASEYGAISGYPDGSFGPEKNVTRAEAATMIYRLIENYTRMAVFVDAENGNDENDGTKEHPVKTIEQARDIVRPYLGSMQNHIFVKMKGTFQIDAPVEFGSKDSGENGFRVVYTKWGEEKPTLSGGREYGNFKLYDAEKNIYRTYVGAGTIARQIYINGYRATRARTELSERGIIGTKYDGRAKYQELQLGYLKNPTRDIEKGTYLCDNVELASVKNQSDIEAVYYEEWTNPRAKVQKMEVTDEGKCLITMQSDSWQKVWSNNGNSTDSIRPNYPAFLENAYEFLDMDGEWYLNKKDGYLYYKPRQYEDPETMVATVPMTEMAVVIAGTNPDDKIHHLQFDDITFRYFTWLYPSTSSEGYRELQAGQSFYYAGDGRLTGSYEDPAVVLADAAYVDITDCRFLNLGGAGLNMREIIQHCNIIGNEFGDISGTGINLGVGMTDQKNTEKFRLPKEYRYFRIYNEISNNYIHDVAQEYHGCLGLAISWTKRTQVHHNEIGYLPYTGIHTGWGWTAYRADGTATVDLDITENYVHDTQIKYLQDGACIYNCGATGGSLDNYNQVSYNYLENHGNAPAVLYPDNGTSYIEYYKNVIDQREYQETGWVWKRLTASPYKISWIHFYDPASTFNHKATNNYSTTEHCNHTADTTGIYEPALVYEDANWPDEAQAIVDNAGLEAAYLERFNPDSIQGIKINDHRTEKEPSRVPVFYMDPGETLQLDVTGRMRKLERVALSSDELYFHSSDESIATVDENGLVTIKGQGFVKIFAQYIDGDFIREAYIEIYCDDEVETVSATKEFINTGVGSVFELGVDGKTIFGNTRTLDSASYTVEDPSIVEVTMVDGKAQVKGLKGGDTTIHGTYTSGDKTFEKSFPVHVIAYVKDNAAQIIETSTKLLKGDKFFTAYGWTKGAEASDGGVTIAHPQASYYVDRIGSELLSFDLTINDPNSWPSLAIRSQSSELDYAKADVYLMGIKPDHIELQRFNSGQRTMIFGIEDLKPIEGPGRPNFKENGETLFEYGKRYSITVGALDEKDGVRLILAINGVPFYDYLDTGEGAIRGGGYFGVYAFEGNFRLDPYTATTFSE